MDRRGSPRKEIHLYCEAGGRAAEAINMSAHGVLIRLAQGGAPPNVGDTLELWIEIPAHRQSATRWLSCTGHVVRVAVQGGGAHVAVAIKRARFTVSKDTEMPAIQAQSTPRAPA
ncbi:MAG: PilZ domain-containing protein [Bryobacterales bacterium]|nr:PilZ domain-containing protein [Bryobacterales bacterium]